MFEQFFLLVGSIIANAMSAFAGGGAGLVQLPMILLMGLPFAEALATHKLVTVALGLGAFVRFWRERHLIDFRFALFILLLGVLGAIVGALVIVQVPETIAHISLSILIIGLGLYSLFKKGMGQDYCPKNRNALGFFVGGLVMFCLGVLNGSLTAGTGLFVTVFLVMWFGMDYQRAVAYTMTLVGIYWNLTGGVTLVVIGEPVYWVWVPVLLVGSFVGGYIGAHFGTLKGNKWIKVAFVSVTLLSGVSLLWKVF